MLKILTLPNPILRKKAKPVGLPAGRQGKFTPEIKKLVGEMTLFLKTGGEKEGPKGKAMGVGLAAPQIGQSLKIIIIWSAGSRQFLTMINPKIIWHSKRTKLGIPNSKSPYEGCLSVPRIWGKVRRYSVIKVRYLTPTDAVVIRKFKGLTGVIVQHETDHLEGILFIDRIAQQRGKVVSNI